MKTISIENIGFNVCDDPVQTEEIINKNIINNLDSVSDEYVYFSFPLAWGINNFGLGQMQALINQLNNEISEKIVYVCQHIQVKNLDFGNNIVFTPHATVFDNFIPIPHHAPNKTADIKKYEDRKYLISFVGSYSTHSTRAASADALQNRKDCFFRDTGNWHFYKTGEELKNSSEFYINNLNDSKISLCPRGTGPSTIRLWEALAMGSVPMVISDDLKMPLSEKVEWKEHIIVVPEADISNIEKYIPEEEELSKMSENCIETYKKYFSEERMHEIITGELNGKV